MHGEVVDEVLWEWFIRILVIYIYWVIEMERDDKVVVIVKWYRKKIWVKKIIIALKNCNTYIVRRKRETFSV